MRAQKGGVVVGCRNKPKEPTARNLGKGCDAQDAPTASLRSTLLSLIDKPARSSISIAAIAASAFGTNEAAAAHEVTARLDDVEVIAMEKHLMDVAPGVVTVEVHDRMGVFIVHGIQSSL
jgi:hypothetical protein